MNEKLQPSLPAVLWPHLVRLVIGGIFIFAGYVKIVDQFGFGKNVFQYQILPDLGVNLSAILLPWLEVFIGAALILIPRLRRGAAAWIFILLVIFTSAVILSIHRGFDISCGCLSTDPHAAKIGWKKVAENCGMIALSAIAFIQAGRHPSLK